MSGEDANITIDFCHRISLIRYLGSSMAPVRLKMQAEVFPNENAEEIDFDVTFAKIKFWLETVVARCVVFSRTNRAAMDMMLTETGTPRVVNHLMMTPFEPTDEHLAVLLQSKMTAFAKGSIDFGGIRVESEDGGLVFSYVGDWHDDLPPMTAWFNVKPYYFAEPWWQRDDASTMDVIAENADLTQTPPWAYRLDFIDRAIRPTPDKPLDEVVIRGAFRPKIILGGGDNE